MSEEGKNQPSDTEELLRSELRAMEHWDAMYRQKQLPTLSDDHAFASRQERRCEIIRQLAESPSASLLGGVKP
jgi:hypothetical protein